MKGFFLIFFVVAALMLVLVGGLISGVSLNDKNDTPPNIDIAPDEAVTEEVPPKKDITPSVVIPPKEPVGPAFRESVIVYFEEMPASLEDFASQYDVKLIFAHEEIKMAAFETNPTSRSAQTSQITLDFINEASKDSLVEKAYKDGFLFIRPGVYTPEPKITYQEGGDYVPNEIIVGFWRMPPSLEDFAARYGATIDGVNNGLLSVTFRTSNVSEFVKKISTDPYIRYVEPNYWEYAAVE